MFKINKVKKDDIRELSDTASAIIKEHYDPIIGPLQNDYMISKFHSVESLNDQIANGYRFYWISFNEKKAGYFAIIPRDGKMFLSKLYLKKEYRRRHFGTKVINYIYEKACSEGLTTIFLNVNRKNYGSIKAYKKIGFKIVKKEKNDIGNGYYMDDYVMEYSR